MLVDAGKEEYVVAFEPMIAGEHIGQNFFVSVADVWRRVRIIDRGRDVKFFGHLRLDS